MNKNAIPNDPQSPFVTSGIRIGTPAVTTRGLIEEDMDIIAECIYLVLRILKIPKIKSKLRLQKFAINIHCINKLKI